MSTQRKHGLRQRVKRAAEREDPANRRRWTEDQPRPKPWREETEAHGPEASVIRAWRAEP